jgi:simple sugar transport system permease protein
MDGMTATLVISAVLFSGAPVALAVIGETLSEKSGFINLSLDGAILLSAMGAFAVAVKTGSLLAGFTAGALIGAGVAAVAAVFVLRLGVSQIATGFVLSLMTRDMAYFLGAPYAGLNGPRVPHLAIPRLSDLPLVGAVLFDQNPVVYLSFVMMIAVWWLINRTSLGLNLRAAGERPEAAFARGIDPAAVRLACAAGGGLLAGLAGGAYSLCVKAGWGHPQGAEGVGWIALALVIFGRWGVIRAAMGAYFFALLQVGGICLQPHIPWVPAQVFQVAPFPLMIFTLLLLNLSPEKRIGRLTETGHARGNREGMPAALGQPWPDSR